jgi:hypothetical protein
MVISAVVIYFISSNSNTSLYSDCAPEDFQCVVDANLVFAKNSSVESGLTQMRNYLEETQDTWSGDYGHKSVRNEGAQKYDSCHYKMHVVGSAYYSNFLDEAVVPGFDFCEGSYYHGLFTEMALTHKENIEKFTSKVSTLCNEMAAGVRNSKYFLGACMHSVGHAGYKLFENVESAIETCLLLESEYIFDCVTGIFMEFTYKPLGSDKISDYSIEKCLTLSEPNAQVACVGSMSIFLFKEGLTFEQACSSFSGFLLDKCALSYGWKLTVSNVTQPVYDKLIEQCVKNTACLGGVGWGFAASTQNKVESLNKCEEFSDRYTKMYNLSQDLNTACSLGAKVLLKDNIERYND